MQDRSFASDFAAEAMKGAPPVTVAASTLIGAVDWQTWVMVLTAVYVGLQIVFLLWKLIDKARGIKVGDDG